jgi:hypothetical protein
MLPILAAAISAAMVAFAPARVPAVPHPIVTAQAGVTFGWRDDLGPRYDSYSERDNYRPPPYGEVCRWMTVRTPAADGKVRLRRERVGGFKVPARQ